MPAVHRVLIPGLTTDEAATDAVFRSAGDIEVVYGLPREDRALGFMGGRVAEREAKLQEALLQHLPRADAVHAMGITGHLPFGADMMERAPSLRVVFIQAAGTDMIDVRAATERGILVLNAPGANAPAVAEHAVGLMLALTRQIAETDRYSHRTKEWARMRMSGPRPLSLLAGKTLGVIGFGFVGRTVARICQTGFGMRTVGFDPNFDVLEARRLGVTLLPELSELLQTADIVAMAIPLTAQTRHLIDATALSQMKSSALLINVGRGGTLDTDALVSACGNGTIAGAGLDVCEPEPLPPDHPLFALDNVVLTPHCGGASAEVLLPTAVTASELAVEALHGHRPRHLINPEAWERHVELFWPAQEQIAIRV
jgi:D-3-phosphoglycerate dehydrogenase